MTIPGSIAVLATVVEFERNGFGSYALKVALLYMKEYYVHDPGGFPMVTVR